MRHQWFNPNFMKLREYFFERKTHQKEQLYSSDWKQGSARACSAAPHACVVVHSKRVVDSYSGERNSWIKSLFFVFFVRKCILVASKNYSWTIDVTWTILSMFLVPFWTLNMIGPFLSMEGLRALGIHQKYLTLCSDERRSFGFGTTWGWAINDRIFIFGWTNPLRSEESNL